MGFGPSSGRGEGFFVEAEGTAVGFDACSHIPPLWPCILLLSNCVYYFSRRRLYYIAVACKMLLEREKGDDPSQTGQGSHTSLSCWMEEKGAAAAVRLASAGDSFHFFSLRRLHPNFFFFHQGGWWRRGYSPSSSHQHDKFIGYNATTTALIPLDFS